MRPILTRFLLLAGLLLAITALEVAATESGAKPGRTETLTLGGGCFWCLEAVFTELKGVSKVESGYAGGHVPNPTYTQVSDGGTGHAEVVQITFDPDVVSLDTILRAFFTIHDPTTLNRQGNDVGEQYRSVIFYENEAQHQVALQAKKKAQADWADPIVTEIAPAPKFWRAEDYHQEYWEGEGQRNPYCLAVIPPKLQKLRKSFAVRSKAVSETA